MSRRAYYTDLNDAEWHKIAPLIPGAKLGERPRSRPQRYKGFEVLPRRWVVMLYVAMTRLMLRRLTRRVQVT